MANHLMKREEAARLQTIRSMDWDKYSDAPVDDDRLVGPRDPFKRRRSHEEIESRQSKFV